MMAGKKLESTDRSRALHTAERGALVALTTCIFVFFSVLSSTKETFPSLLNLQTMAGNSAVVSLAALAALIPLVANQYDVSVGAILGASTIACASALEHGWAIAPAVIVAIVVGAALGAVNGFFVARVGIGSFILTLATGTLITGLVALYTDSQPIVDGIPPSMTAFGAERTLGVPKVVWVVLLAAAAVWYTLAQTRFGRRLYSIGSNERAARLVGMPVRRVLWSSYIWSGALAGVAGVVLLASTGSADPAIGPGYTLAALAAGFLGATSIYPGRFNVPGTLVGLAFIAISVNGLTLAGAAGWVDPVFNGSALLFALVLSTLLARSRVGLRT